MGCFYYRCKECNKPVKSEDDVVLIHMRYGKELGRCKGKYNEYGGVIGSDFNDCENSGINGHDEIIKSEFGYNLEIHRDVRINTICQPSAIMNFNEYINYIQSNLVYSMNHNLSIKGTELHKNYIHETNKKALPKFIMQEYLNKTLDCRQVLFLLDREKIFNFFEKEYEKSNGLCGVLAFHQKCYDAAGFNDETTFNDKIYADVSEGYKLIGKHYDEVSDWG